ncbi:MrcB family domain-containing protein [Fictibacillus phosphorivorans]|uniref:MrcB family domain-containing protein n=1 Tax=Fictibacillus phosphorivorans TaxID=1221500 RepID=UPI003CFAAC01
MLEKLIINYLGHLKDIQTLSSMEKNSIKLNDKGLYVETDTSKRKFVVGEKDSSWELISFQFLYDAWNEFSSIRLANSSDFVKAKGRSSFIMALFSQLPFVSVTQKNGKKAIMLNQFFTDQLPEINLNQVLELLEEVIAKGLDLKSLKQRYPEDNVYRLKSRARQGLKLLGFIDSQYVINVGLIEEYRSSKVRSVILKKQMLKHTYFSIVYELLSKFSDLEKVYKFQAIKELGMLIVKNSTGDNLMRDSVADVRTRYMLSWMQEVDLLDEELNPIMEESIRPLLIKTMQDYLTARTEPLTNHPIGKLVRNELPNAICRLPFIDSNTYSVKGSVGQGNWATVPWLAILNKNVTPSTQRGYYIVYLFSENMKELYLTFAQGITETSRNEMLKMNEEIRENIVMDGVKKSNDYFLGVGAKARGYVESTAAYIKYSLDNMPSENQLVNDLEKMISYYESFIDYKKERREEEMIVIPHVNEKEITDHIHSYIQSKGFYYKKEEVINLYLSLKTKPFVILSGISGTGKTKMVQWFAESVGATERNGQFTLIPVRPDWSDGSDLLGYVDIKGDFKKGPLTSVLERAMDDPTKPFFVLLDEMNLARVEYYFSDLLSVMESRRREDREIITTPVLAFEVDGRDIILPSNVYIVGTVNMDETTYPFSKKVLDRANTIEFNRVQLDHFAFLEDIEEQEPLSIGNQSLAGDFLHIKDAYKDNIALIKKVTEVLVNINVQLENIGAQVGYRVRDEICFYVIYSEKDNLLTFEEAIDQSILQKILPRVSGSDERVWDTLKGLYEICTNQVYDGDILPNFDNSMYPKSAQKIVDMIRRYQLDGFTSFWIGS